MVMKYIAIQHFVGKYQYAYYCIVLCDQSEKNADVIVYIYLYVHYHLDYLLQFVLQVELRCGKHPADFWVKRGTALLLSTAA